MPTKAETLKLKTKGYGHYLWRVIRTRAKARGLPCNLDLEYCLTGIDYPEYDPIGIKLDYNRSNRAKWDTASVDRIDNSKGYIKGNLQILSHKLNTIKGSLSAEEQVLIGNWFIRNASRS